MLPELRGFRLRQRAGLRLVEDARDRVELLLRVGVRGGGGRRRRAYAVGRRLRAACGRGCRRGRRRCGRRVRRRRGRGCRRGSRRCRVGARGPPRSTRTPQVRANRTSFARTRRSSARRARRADRLVGRASAPSSAPGSHRPSPAERQSDGVLINALKLEIKPTCARASPELRRFRHGRQRAERFARRLEVRLRGRRIGLRGGRL